MNVKRIAEPIILGSISNIVVNYIFDPVAPDFDWIEFLIASILAVPVTELNRYINRALEKKFSWEQHPWRRFFHHSGYLTLSLILSINILGNSYMWITGKGFFTGKELFIINLTTLVIALLLTVVNWTADFYMRWRKAEFQLRDASDELDRLKSKIEWSSQPIELQKGNTKYQVKVKDLRLAKSALGIIRVYMENGEYGTFPGTLNQLASQLPEHLFFRAARNIIIHREIILAISPSTFGTVQLKTKEITKDVNKITVSRPKAAVFRKWYYSTSG